jgi:indole-3-glycerol phosphate synthase
MRLPPPAPLRLRPDGFDLIAEIKLASPSAGRLAADATDIEARAQAYARAGACAVSVLTEPDRFGGSPDHLQRAARALMPLGVPVMAKDFLVDPAQISAARLAGAGGVLLIIRMLDDEQLRQMLDQATRLGLFVLLEAFDEHDLDRAGALDRLPGNAPVLLGLNCRDLRTLAVDPARFEVLAGRFPDGFPRVAESGIEGPEDAARVAGLGYEAALVGTALMRDPDPAVSIRGLLEAGRAGRESSR